MIGYILSGIKDTDISWAMPHGMSFLCRCYSKGTFNVDFDKNTLIIRSFSKMVEKMPASRRNSFC